MNEKKKIKGNKIRYMNSKSVSMSGTFYVSAFGGGIKKKYSLTWRLKNKSYHSQFLNKNISKFNKKSLETFLFKN